MQETPKRKARKTGVWSRLKSLFAGGESELEAERNAAYECAKRTLQRQVEEGKITAEELEEQLKLLRNGVEQGHAEA